MKALKVRWLLKMVVTAPDGQEHSYYINKWGVAVDPFKSCWSDWFKTSVEVWKFSHPISHYTDGLVRLLRDWKCIYYAVPFDVYWDVREITDESELP